jgi:8-oxo-dGTP pyrophosphatase MutT (NUDIX family)
MPEERCRSLGWLDGCSSGSLNCAPLATSTSLRALMPDRLALHQQLTALDLASSADEAAHRDRMLALLDGAPDCFLRSCFPGHFTGSALVVSADGSRVLLHHHKFLDRWLQFGGHCDGEADVLRVAIREAEEESGIAGLIVTSRRPFDLDIHAIPANPKRGEPPHEHCDIRYVLIAPEGAEPAVSDESHALRWFTPEEMLALPLDGGLRRLTEKYRALLQRRHAG